MEEWIQAFLNDLSVTKAYAANTLSAYRADLSQFLNFLTVAHRHIKTWSRIDKSLLLEYIISLRERGYSAASLSRKVATLKSFFYFLTERGVISADPTATLDTPRVKRAAPHSLTAAQIENLLNVLPTEDSVKALRDRALIEVLAATGLRVSELVGLDVTDVNTEARTIDCRGAGHHARALPVRERAWSALAAYMQTARPQINANVTQSALFLNLGGARLTRQGLWGIVKTYAHAAGITDAVTPYTLRHSFAMQLLRDGDNVAHVQQLLGHSHKTTTKKYTAS